MADLNDYNLPVMTSLYADVVDTLRENIKRVKAASLPITGGTINGALVVNGPATVSGVVTAGGIVSASPVKVKAAAGGDAALQFLDDAGALQGAVTWKRASDTVDLSGTLPVTINGSAPWTAANLTPGNYLPIAGGVITGTLGVTGKLSANSDFDVAGYMRATGTGAQRLPVGTTAQRPAGALGDIRFNSQLGAPEIFKATGWGTIGGGPSLGTDSIIRTNAKVIAENIAFAGNENGSTVGPVTINDGFTVNVVTGSTWVIL